MNPELEAAVKREMNYREPAPRCSACAHYWTVPDETSHFCNRNAFDLPVCAEGFCDFWTQRIMGRNKAYDRKGVAIRRPGEQLRAKIKAACKPHQS